MPLPGRISDSWQKNRQILHVCEIGCGGGDNLKAIEKKAEKKFSGLSFTGIDINPDCIEVARKCKMGKTRPVSGK